MKNEKPTNPLAFPTSSSIRFQEGMTLRDYFAAKAMQAYIATYSREVTSKTMAESAEIFSEDMYKIADAMLTQREH